MGNDTTLWIRSEEDGSSIFLHERSLGVALLWLCCFRLWDFKHYMELRCPVDEAIGQLEYGVRALEEVFGEIAHLRENQAKLTAELETHRGGILMMDFLDAFGEDNTVVGLLIHGLTGFWNPGVKHFYSDEEREKWDLRSPFVLPGVGGVMTWGGALQRICIPLTGGYGDVDGVASFYDRDGRDAFNWNEHDDCDPWLYLIGV